MWVEDEIIKELGNITNLYVFSTAVKVVVTRLGLIMKREQFVKFNEWLMSKGFKEVSIDAESETSWLLSMMGYGVTHVGKRHVIEFKHTKDRKTVYAVYTMNDVVTLEYIVYFEQSQWQ